MLRRYENTALLFELHKMGLLDRNGKIDRKKIQFLFGDDYAEPWEEFAAALEEQAALQAERRQRTQAKIRGEKPEPRRFRKVKVKKSDEAEFEAGVQKVLAAERAAGRIQQRSGLTRRRFRDVYADEEVEAA